MGNCFANSNRGLVVCAVFVCFVSFDGRDWCKIGLGN